MRILAIGAHADDVELGCGGSLLAFAKQGHSVFIHIVTDSAYMAPDGREIRSASAAQAEARASAGVIGASLSIGPFKSFDLSFAEPLNAHLISLLNRIKPDLLLTHWEGDTHPDHQALAKASLHAARRVPSVLCYASNWYRGEQIFDPRFFVDISTTLEGKLELIKTFAGENARTDGAWLDWAGEQAALHGRAIGVRHAEAFLTIRYQIS